MHCPEHFEQKFKYYNIGPKFFELFGTLAHNFGNIRNNGNNFSTFKGREQKKSWTKSIVKTPVAYIDKLLACTRMSSYAPESGLEQNAGYLEQKMLHRFAAIHAALHQVLVTYGNFLEQSKKKRILKKPRAWWCAGKVKAISIYQDGDVSSTAT